MVIYIMNRKKLMIERNMKKRNQITKGKNRMMTNLMNVVYMIIFLHKVQFLIYLIQRTFVQIVILYLLKSINILKNVLTLNEIFRLLPYLFQRNKLFVLKFKSV